MKEKIFRCPYCKKNLIDDKEEGDAVINGVYSYKAFTVINKKYGIIDVDEVDPNSVMEIFEYPPKYYECPSCGKKIANNEEELKKIWTTE